MRILVTGGLGFIGSNFINYWLSNYTHDSIINLDKETYASNRQNVNHKLIKNNYKFVSGDISDRELVYKLVSEVDTIINFAAETHVDNSIENSDLFIKSNYLGVYSLLEAVRKFNVRFHQISTDEVYGSLSFSSKQIFNENSCYNPNNPYAASKAAADHLIRSYVKTHGIRATISICSNNFGPNQHVEKLIPKIISKANKNEKIPIYGNGKNIRDWIYVEDHCRGIDLALKKGELSKTYLFSGRNEITNYDLAKRILQLMGKDENLIEFVKDRKGHDLRYALDPSRAESDLGWKIKYSFRKNLCHTIDHFLNTE